MKLEIQNLNVSFHHRLILKNLNLTVEDGSFFSLLGPSGCGKTTLLKTIAGILMPQSGSLILGNRELSSVPPHRRNAVIVFQDFRLFPNMNVAENVAFPLKMQGVAKVQRSEAASGLLEKVHLGGFEKRHIAQLSGGEQQRVALARALAAKPGILLLDEPFSSLDENLREEMRELVLELHRESGITTVLVTHDQEEALSMSDRIGLMLSGEIIQSGKPEQVYRHPVSPQAANYFGNGQYLNGTVKSGQFYCPLFSCAATVPDGLYTMLLRPSDILIASDGLLSLHVANIQFCGASYFVTLETPDGNLRWKKAVSDRPEYAAGAVLRAKIAADSPVLFSQRPPDSASSPQCFL